MHTSRQKRYIMAASLFFLALILSLIVNSKTSKTDDISTEINTEINSITTQARTTQPTTTTCTETTTTETTTAVIYNSKNKHNYQTPMDAINAGAYYKELHPDDHFAVVQAETDRMSPTITYGSYIYIDVDVALVKPGDVVIMDEISSSKIMRIKTINNDGSLVCTFDGSKEEENSYYRSDIVAFAILP